MTEITVTPEGLGEYRAELSDAAGSSSHLVAVDAAAAARLAPGVAPEHLVEASFRFLLDREPRQSILGRFDLAVIPRYFPEYEAALPRYL